MYGGIINRLLRFRRKKTFTLHLIDSPNALPYRYPTWGVVDGRNYMAGNCGRWYESVDVVARRLTEEYTGQGFAVTVVIHNQSEFNEMGEINNVR